MKCTKQLLALLVVGLLFISCDKDYNTIGEGLVNETHFSQKLKSDNIIRTETINFYESGIVSTPVQTDNLSYDLLGVYNDPVFGMTNANVLSQVTLSEYGKDFGSNPVLSRAVLSMPYFSTKTGIEESGESIYVLDSLYQNSETSAVNLKMYRSEYFLNDFDINGDVQKYYSSDNSFTSGQISPAANVIYSKDDFIPSEEEIVIPAVTSDDTETRLTPRLRDDSLDETNFNWLLDPANVSSASDFKNFYRGVFIETVSSNATDGVLFGLDLSQAEIEVFYEYDDPADLSNRIEGSIKILFSGNKVNLFNNNNFIDSSASDKLVLKGGQGSMAVINLFSGVDLDNNNVSDDLDALRANDWLVNEATLEFYVDQTTMQGGDSEPERVILYDIDNNKVLLDYQFDNTSENDTNLTQLNHLGKLQRDASGNGVMYKIRVTEHIADLIRNDAENVRLGLAVTNNVLSLGSSELKTPFNFDTDVLNSESVDIKTILSSSVTSHRGTVLYNENAIDEDKKLKLRIYYTEENNN
jgi:hypothetical protein